MKPEELFDLTGFSYRDVFESADAVWGALKRIGDYIRTRGAGKIEGKVSAGAWLEGDGITIGADTVVEPGVMIVGPALIGEKCVLRQGAYLRGNVIAGDGCVIGHTTEVKNSIFLNGARAAHFAYVGDSILGAGVNLGAGSKLANFKVDTGDRTVKISDCKGEAQSTGLRKMGAIIGDGAELGCNCVTMPGTIIGRNTLVYPCSVLRGIVPPDSIVKLRQSFEITMRKH